MLRLISRRARSSCCAPSLSLIDQSPNIGELGLCDTSAPLTSVSAPLKLVQDPRHSRAIDDFQVIKPTFKMWIAQLDAVLQLHLVQLNEETDDIGVVFDVEWLFVYARHRRVFGPIQQLISVRHSWGEAPLVQAPVYALGTGSTLAAHGLARLYFLYASSIINIILLLRFHIAFSVAHLKTRGMEGVICVSSHTPSGLTIITLTWTARHSPVHTDEGTQTSYGQDEAPSDLQETLFVVDDVGHEKILRRAVRGRDSEKPTPRDEKHLLTIKTSLLS
ncbi:uncharacterized protein ARMOST_19902 [Armillaria ostoyae]|uniref:Uncharacterized protein n=1 Tax=Armillaria ostoyae TaxID=47428 RepID=A0A284S5V9_ARMOS|nr:uncharacterized protein ARMOST_19902 [Armillaria ostoyae]